MSLFSAADILTPRSTRAGTSRTCTGSSTIRSSWLLGLQSRGSAPSDDERPPGIHSALHAGVRAGLVGVVGDHRIGLVDDLTGEGGVEVAQAEEVGEE